MKNQDVIEYLLNEREIIRADAEKRMDALTSAVEALQVVKEAPTAPADEGPSVVDIVYGYFKEHATGTLDAAKIKSMANERLTGVPLDKVLRGVYNALSRLKTDGKIKLEPCGYMLA